MKQQYKSPALEAMAFSTEEGFAQSGEVKSRMLTDWSVEDVEWDN